MANPKVQGHLVGHPIYIDSDEYTLKEDGRKCYEAWRFKATDELITTIDRNDLVCPKCKKTCKDTNGHDPCIANLPGVLNACCGHGSKPAYIHFEDDSVIRGTDEVEREVKRLRESSIT